MKFRHITLTLPVILGMADGMLAQPKVFLDCNRCDLDYIRREIPYVNYVRDRQDADVHVLITSQRAAAGRKYSVFFIGRERFVGVDDTLTVASSDTDTEDERRETITQRIRLGLVRYLARTPVAAQVIVKFDSSEAVDQAGNGEDKWDYWSFRIGMNGNATAQQATNSFRVGGRINADRITEEWKLRLSANSNYYEENFDIGDDETVTSVIRDGSVDGMIVNSLGSQWSLGGFASMTTSSFNNTKLRASVSPALEYNLFPYSESSRRALTLSYFLALESLNYEEVTVFDKTDQILLQQKFEAELEFKQTWGSASGSLNFSNYITDFSVSLWDLYRIQLFGFAEVRIVRGLSFFVWANASRIRDQIFLPKEEATEEDILLGTIQLPTDFAFSATVGFSYRFGSIYNNIVNPRFGI